MKTLVVHRQKMVADQVKSILQDNSPVVSYCDSGLDGLLAARIECFELLICGIDLPVITGFEMVRSIRTTSVNKQVIVIMLTDREPERMSELARSLRVEAMIHAEDLNEKLPELLTTISIPAPGQRR